MRREKAIVPAVLLLLSGCLGMFLHGVEGTSPRSLEKTFAAASAELVEMGYSIQHADRRAGRIVAAKEPLASGVVEGTREIRIIFTRRENGTHFHIRPATRRRDAPGGTDRVAGTGQSPVTDRPRGAVTRDAEALRRALLQRTGSGSREP